MIASPAVAVVTAGLLADAQIDTVTMLVSASSRLLIGLGSAVSTRTAATFSMLLPTNGAVHHRGDGDDGAAARKHRPQGAGQAAASAWLEATDAPEISAGRVS
ncbi:MAG: hypothetical protein R2856_06810 [Caldilineaceae bacterium]